MASGSADKSVCVWDLTNGTCTHELKASVHTIHTSVFRIGLIGMVSYIRMRNIGILVVTHSFLIPSSFFLPHSFFFKARGKTSAAVLSVIGIGYRYALNVLDYTLYTVYTVHFTLYTVLQ